MIIHDEKFGLHCIQDIGRPASTVRKAHFAVPEAIPNSPGIMPAAVRYWNVWLFSFIGILADVERRGFASGAMDGCAV